MPVRALKGKQIAGASTQHGHSPMSTQAPDDPWTRLREKLLHAETADAGQFRFLNLDMLMARYGERWPRVKDRIFETCQAFISKRIGAGDIIVRAANGFLVFPDPHGGESAAAIAARIDIELKAFFLGTEYLQELELVSDALVVPVQSLLGKHKPAQDEPPESEPVKSPPPEAAALNIKYEPVWASNTGYIAMALAVPFQPGVKGLVRRYHAALDGESSSHQRQLFDSRVIAAVMRQISERPGISRLCKVAVPVHIDTLTTQSLRVAYFTQLTKMDAQVLDMLALRIMGAPSDAPASRINEATKTARLYFKRVLLDMDMVAARFGRLTEAGLDCLLSPAPRSAERFEQTLDQYASLLSKLKTKGVTPGFLDCPNLQVLDKAIEIGVGLVSGPMLPMPEGEVSYIAHFDPFMRDRNRTVATA